MRLIDAEKLHDELRNEKKLIVKEGEKYSFGYTYDQVHITICEQPTVKVAYLPEYQKFDWAMRVIESDDEEGREKARRKFMRSLMRKVNENFDLAVRYKEFSGDIHPHLNDGEALYEFRIVIERPKLEGEKDET